MCKEFLDAVEHHCKGLTAVSSGVCGSCPTCQSDYGMKLRKEDTVVDAAFNLRLKSGYVLREGTKQILDSWDWDKTPEHLHDILWQEFDYCCIEVPQEELNKVFNERVSRDGYPNEGGFSRHDCDTCGSSMAGTRCDGHAVIEETNELIHLSMCEDCVLYFANGDIPTRWES